MSDKILICAIGGFIYSSATLLSSYYKDQNSLKSIDPVNEVIKGTLSGVVIGYALNHIAKE